MRGRRIIETTRLRKIRKSGLQTSVGQSGTAISKKAPEWRVKRVEHIDPLSLLPAPYNTIQQFNSTDGKLVTIKDASVWQVEEFVEPKKSPQLSSVQQFDLSDETPDGKLVTIKDASVWQVEEFVEPKKSPQLSSVQQFDLSDETPGISRPVEDAFSYQPEVFTSPYNDVNYNSSSSEIGDTETFGCLNTSQNKDDGNEINDVIVLNDKGVDAPRKLNSHNSGTINVQKNNEDDSRLRSIILSSFENHETLDDDNRKELIKRIVDFIFNAEIETPDFETIATEVCSVYRCETKDVYYKNRSGKLYEAYNTRLRQLRLKGILPKSKRTLNKLIRMQEAEDIEIDESVEESMNYICKKEDSYVADDCLYHWSNSGAYRHFQLQKPERNLQSLWKEWSVMEHSWSHILISEDFKKKYGTECSKSLIQNWQSTFDEDKSKIIIDLVKDKFTKNQADRLPGSEDYKNISLVNYLIAILFPPLLKRKWKPSIKAAQNTVIQIVKSSAEISKNVMDRENICREKGMEIHPTIFIKENDGAAVEFLVIFHQTQYRFKHLVEALDICFKMFLVLNIPFPLESKQFYVFLNELFYKTSSDMKKSVKVLLLLQKLQQKTRG